MAHSSEPFATRRMDARPNRPFSREEEMHMRASYLSLCPDPNATAIEGSELK